MEIKADGIKLDKELSNLDKFAINFSRSIGKLTEYVIVSGYVSILLGRSRGSEDIDVLIPDMKRDNWVKIYDFLIKEGYYCLNAERNESYDYLKDEIAVRFAPKDQVIPNMEILLAKNKTQKLALKTSIPATVGKDKIIVSDLELQISYKEIILGSDKDIEDARHLRKILGKAINLQKLKKYSVMLNEEEH